MSIAAHSKERSSWQQPLLMILCVAMIGLASWSIVQRFLSDDSVFNTDVLSLIPQDSDRRQLQNVLVAVTDRVSSQQLFLISHPDFEQAKLIAHDYQRRLAETSYIERVDLKIDAEQKGQWIQYLWRHRGGLLAADTRERLLEGGINAQIQQAFNTLHQPFSTVNSELFSQDPLFIFSEYLQSMQADRSALDLEDDYLVVRDGSGQAYIFMQVFFNQGAFSLNLQNTIIPVLDELRTDYDNQESTVLTAGFLRHAAFGVESARAEIGTVGTISLVSCVALLVLTFASLRPLLLTVLTLSLALFTAIGLSLLIFSQLYLVTLVFASSLIGIAIDYCFHSYSDYYFADRKSANFKETLAHIKPGLIVGLLSSLMAYLILLFGGFPGMQQMAVISSLGLAFTCLFIFAFYPLLLSGNKSKRSAPLLKALIARYLGWALWLKALSLGSKRILCLLFFFVIIFCLSLLRADDDVRQLQALSPEWKSQEQDLLNLIDIKVSPAFLLLRAESEQALLALEESFVKQFDDLAASGDFTRYMATSSVMPSIDKQQADRKLLRQANQNEPQLLEEFLGLLSFESEQDAKDTLIIYDQELPWLRPDEQWRALAPEFIQLWLGQQQQYYYSVIQFSDLKRSDGIQALADDHEQLFWINQTDDISRVFGQFRQRAMVLLMLAGLIIYGLWSLRYGFKQGALMLLPPLLAIAISLSVIALLGQTLNLFHLLGFIIVLGMGADYSVFLNEARRALIQPSQIPRLYATLIAIFLSALTSCLAFGLLSLSQTMAVQAFGLSVLLGIAGALLLSPLILLDTKTIKALI